MPRVPIYEQQVESRPIGTPYSQLDSRGTSGEALGQGLQQLAGGLGEVDKALKEERAKADQSAVFRAVSDLQKAQLSALYDANNGFLTKEGHNALADSDKVKKSLADARAKIAASLTSPDQVKAFERHATSLDLDAHRQIENHVSQQIKTIQGQDFKAIDQRTSESLKAQYSDPNSVSTQMALRKQSVIDFAKVHGMSAEATAAMLEDSTARGHVEVLKGYLAASDGPGAKAYLDAHRQELGSHGDEYIHQVDALDIAQRTEETVNGIVAWSSIDNTYLLDTNEMESAYAAIKDSDPIKPHVRSMLDAANARAEKQQLDKVHGAYEVLFSQINQHKTFSNSKDPEIVKAIGILKDAKQKGGDLLHKVQTLEKGMIEEWRGRRDPAAKQKHEDELGALRFELEENKDKYRDPSYTAANFKAEWGDRIGPENVEKGYALVAAAKKRTENDSIGIPTDADRTLVSVAMDNNAISDQDYKKWTPKQSALMRRAQDYVVGKQRAWITAHHGEYPPLEMYEKWSTEVLAKGQVTIPGRFWDSKKEVSPLEYVSDPSLHQYPFTTATDVQDLEKERSGLHSQFRDEGIDPTKDLVEWTAKSRLAARRAGIDPDKATPELRKFIIDYGKRFPMPTPKKLDKRDLPSPEGL